MDFVNTKAGYEYTVRVPIHLTVMAKQLERIADSLEIIADNTSQKVENNTAEREPSQP